MSMSQSSIEMDEKTLKTKIKLEDFMESLPFPLYIIDANSYVIQEANSKAGNAQGRTCYEHTHLRDTPCDGADHPCGLQNVKITGKSYSVEHTHYDEAGKPKKVEVHTHPIRNENGVVNQVIEYAIDISEKLAGKRQLEKLSAELKAIYDNVLQALCMVDMDRKILHGNRALLDMLQVTEEKIIGGDACGAFGCLHSLEDPRGCGYGAGCQNCSILAALEETRITGKGVYNVEKDFTLVGGGKLRRLVVLVTIIPIFVGDDRGILACIEDITERKKNEKELIRARELAEKASKAKSEFLSSMSHELRTPMNAIMGFGQLLEMDKTLNAEQRDYINEVLKAGSHLLDLISELLNLSRIDSGKIELKMEKVDCGELIDECLMMINPISLQKKIRMEKNVPGLMYVFADRIRLKQALINMLSNAVKYNKYEGMIGIEVSPENGRTRITITDTGSGIPGEKLDELFQPFSRLGAESTGVEGTGIGLSITKRLIELMGGTIGVDSNPGSGSTFHIELPSGVSTGQGS